MLCLDRNFQTMSFQPPSAKQEQQNRKLLEEVQLKKKLMLKQQAAVISTPTPATNSACTTANMSPTSGSTLPPQSTTASALDFQGLNKSQRAALQHAHANSYASFITQDSSFGNLILPVMPRFDKQST